MEELTNDNYSDIKLYSIFHIEYKAIRFITNKKEPAIFLHKYMSILVPLFITPFGVAVRGKGKLNILALISPYSEKPKVRHVSEFNLGSFT